MKFAAWGLMRTKGSHSKKGVEMSLNVIVVAALVLITLVVLTIAFTTKFGEFNKQVDDCKAKGGKEMTKEDCEEQDGLVTFRIYDDDDPTGEYCCFT